MKHMFNINISGTNVKERRRDFFCEKCNKLIAITDIERRICFLDEWEKECKGVADESHD